ncbi:MAG: response regulator [Desulfobacterales bacterium]|nr:response regulator [Desulfobacterales bacterium]
MEPLKLVIIEDEEAHFKLMKGAIVRAFPRASVDYFEDAGSCLERLDEIAPDIIVTDYLMPGMNGLELLEALKRENKDIPLIMITGQGDENIAARAMKLGAADYLVKSVDFFSLLPSVINQVVGERKLKESFEESKKRFKQIFAESPIGIELYDSNSLLIDLNKSCLDIFGIADAADVIGFELFADQNVASKFKDRVAKGETVRYEVAFDFEEIKKRKLYKTTKSGTIHLDVLITPLAMGDAPGALGYLVQIQDITARKLAEEHVRSLTGELMKAQENERQRLSRDLHDHVAQDLFTIKIGLDTFFDDQPESPLEIRKRVSELSKMIHGTITAVRELAYGLRPTSLDHLGLAQTVLRHCEEFSAKTGVKVDFFAAGIDDLQLDFDTKITLYRLIQEGLNNVKNHADASRVTIKLVASFPNIILRIEDNGKGFDVLDRLIASIRERRMGLRSMDERVGLLNGKMRIESRPMQGTKILIEVPCKGKNSGKEENHPDC